MHLQTAGHRLPGVPMLCRFRGRNFMSRSRCSLNAKGFRQPSGAPVPWRVLALPRQRLRDVASTCFDGRPCDLVFTPVLIAAHRTYGCGLANGSDSGERCRSQSTWLLKPASALEESVAWWWKVDDRAILTQRRFLPLRRRVGRGINQVDAGCWLPRQGRQAGHHHEQRQARQPAHGDCRARPALMRTRFAATSNGSSDFRSDRPRSAWRRHGLTQRA